MRSHYSEDLKKNLGHVKETSFIANESVMCLTDESQQGRNRPKVNHLF